MKKRPLVIWVVGLALVLSPIYYFLYAQLTWRGGLGNVASIPARVGPFNLVGIALAPIVGSLVLRVRPVGWYAVVGYALYTLAANAVTYQVHFTASRFFLFSAVGAACVLVFLRREIRSPYFNPRLRWWETPTRYRLRLGVTISGREAFSTTTFDINDRGCFVATPEAFKPGEHLDLTLDFGGRAIPAPGTVAWVSDGVGHPKGIGIKFDRASAAIAEELKKYRTRDARFAVELPVRVSAAGQAPQAAKTFDISRSGCFVTSDRPLPEGTQVEIALELDSGPTTLRGVVKWFSDGASQPRGMGIEFLGRESRAVANLIRKLEQSTPERAPLTR